MDARHRILIVEDDTVLSDSIAVFLDGHGYDCTQAYSGSEAYLLCLDPPGRNLFDLIVCDLLLPGLPGEEFIEAFREQFEIPIIAISAKAATTDIVGTLRMGADDYLIKPFELEELLARIESRLRRSPGRIVPHSPSSETIVFGRWTIDPDSREFFVDGSPLTLTRIEFEVVKLLGKHPYRVFSRSEIACTARNGSFEGIDKTVDTHIGNIRKKLRPSGTDVYIQAVRGVGFKLSIPNESPDISD